MAVYRLLLLLLIMELGSWAVGLVLQAKWKMYKPPVFRQGGLVHSYDDYLRVRDPILGWPSPAGFGGSFYDSSGARFCPAYPDPNQGRSAVSLFGDSFVAGIEVDNEHAWGNRLAQLLRARVNNLGVSGYGTDQAYLRFHLRPADASPVVIMGYCSENILRNLTRNRDLYTLEGHYSLKPRFVLDDGDSLRLVPLPRLSGDEYLRSVGLESPFLPLPDESFQPGGPAGITRLEFPFTLSILRNFRSSRMRATLARRPDYAEFYRRGHPLQGLEITTRILSMFQREALARGQWPLVILLPTIEELEYHGRTGRWTYANLVEELDRVNVNLMDFGPHLVEYLGGRDPRSFFKPMGHYGEELNDELARWVHEALKTRGRLPQ